MSIRRDAITVRYAYRDRNHATPTRVAFAIRRGKWPKPRRNRLRRLVREAYRHARPAFDDTLRNIGAAIDLVIIWSGNDIDTIRPSFERIRTSVEHALQGIVRRIRAQSHGPDHSR